MVLFLPTSYPTQDRENVAKLKNHPAISEIYFLTTDTSNSLELPDRTKALNITAFNSSAMVKAMAGKCESADFVLLFTKPLLIKFGLFALDRLIQTADQSNAGMVYSDYYMDKKGEVLTHPVNDYQEGSLRDDFDFGPVCFFKASIFKEVVSSMEFDYQYAGLYDLRLRISQESKIFRLPEFLYTVTESDHRKSGEKIFDYVDPKNRQVQIEMEEVCTHHLKRVGAWLKPDFKEPDFNEGDFLLEASVIIPVKNRVKTVEEAVRSVLSQVTDFNFNIIVVDNHSSDGTTELIHQLSNKDERIVHLIPETKTLGIGGCWNLAVMNEKCGRFSVQLDSDDLYAGDDTLQKIVDAFYTQNCAMVVGTYQMVNFNLEEIPPGLIDHKEWTPDNGRNNALRINGLGAPRAFLTSILRKIQIPDVSYGEDYAVGLAFSREYQIGRIYDSLYLCRRWEGNSDAELDVEKMNRYNFYKDRIRTLELWKRKWMNNQNY